MEISLALGQLGISESDLIKMVLNISAVKWFIISLFGLAFLISLIFSGIDYKKGNNAGLFFRAVVIPLAIAIALFIVFISWDKFPYWFDKIFLSTEMGVN